MAERSKTKNNTYIFAGSEYLNFLHLREQNRKQDYSLMNPKYGSVSRRKEINLFNLFIYSGY